MTLQQIVNASQIQGSEIAEDKTIITEKTESFLIKNMESLSRNYNFIILTTRRCFCIYSAMVREGIINDYSNVFSSQKVDIIGDEFNGSNVLLIDDVMIHGTAVNSIYEKINDEYHAQNIDTLVFTRNVEYPDYYQFKTKEYIALTKVVGANWRDFSNQFVNYIHSKNQLYISYIYGYLTNAELIEDALTKTNCYQFIDTTKILSNLLFLKFSDLQKFPDIYITSFEKKYSFIKKSSLRIYGCPNCNENVKQVLPYVELKNFKTDNLINIWNNIWKNNTIPSELCRITKTEDIFKALVTITSLFMYQDIFYPDKEISELTLFPTQFIDKSYVNNFINCIQLNIKSDALDIISSMYEDILNEESPFNYESDNLSTLKNNLDGLVEQENICDRNKQIAKFIQMCIYNISQEEERNFKKAINDNISGTGELININDSIENRQPINSNWLYDFLHLDASISDIMYAIMIFFLDCGIISHNVICINGVVGTFIKTGEQSYHLFSDLLGIALRPAYRLFSYIYRLNGTKKDDFIRKFICKLKETDNYCISKYKDSIVFLLENPPVDFRADYYGMIKLLSRNIAEEEIDEENEIMSVLNNLIFGIVY